MSSGSVIVLHTSWRGRLTAFLGPSLVLGWGVYGVSNGGVQLFNGTLVAMGGVLLCVVAFDYPLTSAIGPDGVARRCLLRTEQLGWEQIRTIARPGARQRFFGRSSDPVEAAEKVAKGRSGLVAEVGKRPHLLVDQLESRAEFEAVELGLRAWAPNLTLRASRPVEGTPPTWLYKRRRSEVEGMVDRRG
jgi:hypothetical protein